MYILTRKPCTVVGFVESLAETRLTRYDRCGMPGTRQLNIAGSAPTPREELLVQQVKLFKGIESEVSALEAEVNAWIRESGAKIISVTGNVAPQSNLPDGKGGTMGRSLYPPSDILLVVLYEPTEA